MAKKKEAEVIPAAAPSSASSRCPQTHGRDRCELKDGHPGLHKKDTTRWSA